jgi:hypothetical protein
MTSGSITSELDQLFREREQQDKFSGVVLITRPEQELFSGAYGYASRAWKVPNTMETRFDTASITKLFPTVALLQFIDQGLLTFETSAIDYLGLQGTKISSEVNVHHLLTHTSGIADASEEEDGEIYEDLFKTKPNYSIRNTEDFLHGCWTPSAPIFLGQRSHFSVDDAGLQFVFVVQDGFCKWNGIPAANKDVPLEVHISGREDHQNGKKCRVETLKKLSSPRYLCKKPFLKKLPFSYLKPLFPFKLDLK